MIKYFDFPTQIKFFCPTDEEPQWESGIGYKDEIVCGCCGSIFKIENVYQDAKDYGITPEEAIDEYRMWVNFSEYIGEL